MPRPGQLAGVLAEVFDLELATVRHQARILRDAGLMTLERGGRGEGTMTCRDAVNLLIAVAGSSRVKYSAIPVTQHGACTAKEGAWTLPFEGPAELLALGPSHTFADALEALLLATINDDATPELDERPWRSGYQGGRLRVEVAITDPYPRSDIRIGLYARDEDGALMVVKNAVRCYTLDYDERGLEPPLQFLHPSDLSHTHSFTELTLYKLGRLFQ